MRADIGGSVPSSVTDLPDRGNTSDACLGAVRIIQELLASSAYILYIIKEAGRILLALVKYVLEAHSTLHDPGSWVFEGESVPSDTVCPIS